MDDIPGGLVGKQVGNYSATKLIGKGSMGEVYQGTHPILDKQVAIKVLSQELSAYPELVSRFRREARAIARIKHPAIVEAFDFGNTSDGRCYYVMELLKGTNLANYMHAKGALPLTEAMDIAIPLLEGLSAAHEAGFIHRDIKPDNIFLVRTEEGKLFPKLIDFGIAKLRNPDEQGDSVVTRIDAVMGTPLYMSPEQAPGSTETVGAWSDIYSTAATLYHVLCGKPPFYSDNPLELMLMHSWSSAPSPREVLPEIPEAISDVLMTALAKKPGDRYSSMQAFTAALQGAISGQPVKPVATPPGGQDEDGEGPEFGDTMLGGEPLQEVEGVLLDDEDGDGPATPAAGTGPASSSPPIASAQRAESPVAAGAKDVEEPGEVGAPGGEKGARAARPALEEAPPLEDADAGGSIHSSLSGIASEKVIDAPPPDTTMFRRRRSPLPWILAGVGVIAGGVAAYFLLRSSSAPPTPPTRYQQVSARTRHTCAILDGGKVACWGRNNYGQLGLGDTRARLRPTLVDGLSGAKQIATGGRHTCVLLAEGDVRCWGRNHRGQLGDGTSTDRNRPVPVKGLIKTTAISAGADHTCALVEDGSLRCWGRNDRGQLGIGQAGAPQPTPRPLRDPKAVLKVAAGGFHTCALDANGSVWCWGRNDVGQLGLGDAEGRNVATKVDGLAEVVGLTSGGSHCCAIRKGGQVSCWGDNASGQLGDGTTSAQRVPHPVKGLPAARWISAGGGYLGGHTCAIAEDGALYCWGSNSDGQLGREPAQRRFTVPVKLTAAGKVRSVVAGGLHTCAIQEPGALYCWGANRDGQLGDGTNTDQPAPRKIR